MPKPRPVLTRFMEKVDPSGPEFNGTPCWLWIAYTGRKGYGQTIVGGRMSYAHRVSYELFVGPIPDGLQLDHLCRVRACVNPAHLEPVTGRENTLRGNSITNVNSARTHCPQGHPYSGENLYINPRGERQCRTCNRAKCAAYQARRTGDRIEARS